MSSAITPIYCNAEEARQILGLPSAQALYRRVRLGQVAGVERLKEEEGSGPGGRPRHGSLWFIRAELRLRPSAPPAPQSTTSEEVDPEDPLNWQGRLTG